MKGIGHLMRREEASYEGKRASHKKGESSYEGKRASHEKGGGIS